jgi:hypothetical protein
MLGQESRGAAELLQLYKSAVEYHDVDILAEIFAEEAVYEEKPNSVFRNIEEIKGYWEHNAGNQRNVRFKVARLIECDNQAVAEWEASFFRTDLGRNMDLFGVMWIQIESGKISHLREYFFKQIRE